MANVRYCLANTKSRRHYKGLLSSLAAELVFLQVMMNADIKFEYSSFNRPATKAGRKALSWLILGGALRQFYLVWRWSLSFPLPYSSAGNIQLSESTLAGLNSINGWHTSRGLIQASLVAEASGLKLSQINGPYIRRSLVLQNNMLEPASRQPILI